MTLEAEKPTEFYECKNCGNLNLKNLRCLCGGLPVDLPKSARRGGRSRWFECECGHVGKKPVHCGFSYVRRGTQGDYRRAWLEYRDGPGCQKCGTEENLTLDHVLPRSRGGKNHISNLQLLCKPCNNEKGDLTMEEWRRQK